MVIKKSLSECKSDNTSSTNSSCNFDTTFSSIPIVKLPVSALKVFINMREGDKCSNKYTGHTIRNSLSCWFEEVVRKLCDTMIALFKDNRY